MKCRGIQFAVLLAATIAVVVMAVPDAVGQSSPDEVADRASGDGPKSGPKSGPANGAGENTQQTSLTGLWDKAIELLARASAARQPPLVPPTPISIRWRARRISSVDLGSPLLAMESVDLDGNGRAEIVALTARELLVIALQGRRTLRVLSRVALPPKPAALRPRDPVGTLVVRDFNGDGQIAIAARSSHQSRGAVYRYGGDGLVEIARPEPQPDESPAPLSLVLGATSAGKYPLCVGANGELEPGRNYFTVLERAPSTGPLAQSEELPPDMPKQFFAAHCRRDLVDPAGRGLDIAGVVGSNGTLVVWTRFRCRTGDYECRELPGASTTLPDVGVAFALADINRDGRPEVAVTSASAPGDPDHVVVLSWRKNRLEPTFRRSFSGGVAGLASGDIDGDSVAEVIAAVRPWRSTRIDLWTLN